MNMNPGKEITILIVDDEKEFRQVLLEVCGMDGYTCLTASNGNEALQVLKRQRVDVVITDIVMPEMDGIKLTRAVREKYDSDVIMMTGYVKDLKYGDAIAGGASDFIQKPFDIKELLIRLKRVLRERSMRGELRQSLHREQGLRRDLDETLHEVQHILEGVVHTISSMVEIRDPYTSGHQIRVANLAGAIAQRLGLPDSQVIGIRMAGAIHDLGKIAVPSEILTKPSRLSEMEYSILKTHPKVGRDIPRKVNFPWPIAEIIYQHHERMDGSGYPKGIKGEEILLEARIMAVADVVESMSNHRPYRPSLGIETALDEITKNKGTMYDPDVVDACLEVVRDKEFRFSTEMNYEWGH
jgi:putative two-component system response regulator